MPDSSRRGARVPHVVSPGGVGPVWPSTDDLDEVDARSGVGYATGVAGLSPIELTAMIHQNLAGDPSASEALAPYLAVTPALSADAYKEWLARVCEQPDDD